MIWRSRGGRGRGRLWTRRWTPPFRSCAGQTGICQVEILQKMQLGSEDCVSGLVLLVWFSPEIYLLNWTELKIVELIKFRTGCITFHVDKCTQALKVCLLPTFANEVGVTNVDGVVDAESDGKYNGDTRDNVDCEAPEVEHAHDIHQRQHHAHQHHQADPTQKNTVKKLLQIVLFIVCTSISCRTKTFNSKVECWTLPEVSE